jgi:hypothetical protein
MGNWRSKPAHNDKAAVIRHYRTDDGLYELIVGDGEKCTVTCYKDRGPQEYDHMKGVPRCTYYHHGLRRKVHSPCTHLSQSMWVQLDDHEKDRRLLFTPTIVDEIVKTHSQTGDWCNRCITD